MTGTPSTGNDRDPASDRPEMVDRFSDRPDDEAGSSADAGASAGAKWIAVDLARIIRLPTRLKRLWPPEMMPRSTSKPDASAAEDDDRAHTSANASTPAPDLPGALTAAPPAPQRRRDLDVLTAWLTGFAAELEFADARMTLVISTGADAVHLEAALHDHTALAILVLRGPGFDQFRGFQLLRRITLTDLAPTVQELSTLIEEDCVLTLTYLHSHGAGGMEFLLRQHGHWLRPELERRREEIRVSRQVDAGDEAIRTLLAAVLTQLCFTSAQSPAATNGVRA